MCAGMRLGVLYYTMFDVCNLVIYFITVCNLTFEWWFQKGFKTVMISKQLLRVTVFLCGT